MNLFSFLTICFIGLGVNKTRIWVLRWWHRKKFCESNRELCRALIIAGFPDFKEYLFFKEDTVESYKLWYKNGCIDFKGSGMSRQDKERILKVVQEYYYCFTDNDKESNIIRIYLQEHKFKYPMEE